MSLTLDLSPEEMELLESEAAIEGTDVTGFAKQELTLLARRRATARSSEGYVRPTTPPAWLDAIKPLNPPTDGTNGLHRIIGKWPGDESEEELLAAEKRFDDEDAGRV